ncbi:MAG: carbamoyltransferase C-terminal domain-containing protein [Planctomycetota bacterium]
MIVLGVGCSFEHDPSAALLVDGEVVAAVDEERFTREKHAIQQLPVQSIRYCMKSAGVSPGDIDAVAFPWSYVAYRRLRWRYFRRNLRTRTDHALKAIVKGRNRRARKTRKLLQALEGAGIRPQEVRLGFIEHHLAHAASSYHFSGFEEAAILTLDAKGEFTATMLAEGRGGEITILKEILNPDSLGYFYSTLTEYLGFQVNDGEFKVMGMSAYGDPKRIDLSPIIRRENSSYSVNEKLIWVAHSRRYQGKHFPEELVRMLGAPRSGDGLTEPYTHIAAAVQKTLEDVVLSLIDGDLAPVLDRCGGRLCLAGGCALNVRMNRKLLEHAKVSSLWVQPAAHDSGTSLGAAALLATELGDRVKPMVHSYLGPEYDDAAIVSALERFAIPSERPQDIIETTADLLAEGHVVAWFQGRMEYGPRALGNRSILAHPGREGMSDEINGRIKFRENWRPFCPSIKREFGREILGTDHDSPFMTFSFHITPEWRDRIREAVHVDNTCRPQLVSEEVNPRFYQLLSAFQKRTGLPALLNTSLNRRGEPMVCSPEDAIAMFYGSGLDYLVLGDRLVRKQGAS